MPSPPKDPEGPELEPIEEEDDDDLEATRQIPAAPPDADSDQDKPREPSEPPAADPEDASPSPAEPAPDEAETRRLGRDVFGEMDVPYSLAPDPASANADGGALARLLSGPMLAVGLILGLLIGAAVFFAAPRAPPAAIEFQTLDDLPLEMARPTSADAYAGELARRLLASTGDAGRWSAEARAMIRDAAAIEALDVNGDGETDVLCFEPPGRAGFLDGASGEATVVEGAPPPAGDTRMVWSFGRDRILLHYETPGGGGGEIAWLLSGRSLRERRMLEQLWERARTHAN